MTTTHGGKREGAGRKSTGKTEYLRTPVLTPKTTDQANAIAWYASLTPRDRLAYITELWFDCNCPNPKNRPSDIE
jgi:hypothetical protein